MIGRIPLPIFLVIACFLCFAVPVKAQKLRVGAAGSAPFIIKDESDLKGIGIDVWQQMAVSQGWQYDIVPQENISSSLKGIVDGQLDVAIGPISITSERLQKVAFTQPFYQAEIGLLISSDRPTLWSRLSPFFGIAFISSVGVLSFALFVVGNLLWLAERHHNSEHFPKQYLKGVGNGMWFAIVTLTTVGYGDRAPITIPGRMIAAMWMVVTMVTASSLTAGLATALTLSLSNQRSERFNRPEDLQASRIAVVSDTTGVKWAGYYGARLNRTNNLADAIALLRSGKVDGVVFDSPALKYYLYQNPQEPFRVAEFPLATENYGFVVPFNSPLLQKLNVMLLQMQETGRLNAIEKNWLN